MESKKHSEVANIHCYHPGRMSCKLVTVGGDNKNGCWENNIHRLQRISKGKQSSIGALTSISLHP